MSLSAEVPLEDVLLLDAIARRPSRLPDLASENQGLHRLARQLPDEPQRMLDTLVTLTMESCGAGSAGVSLLQKKDDGRDIFRWVALAGKAAAYPGGTTPFDWSPCGVCLARGSATLFFHPERHFTYFRDEGITIVEGLVVPLRALGRDIGTLWVMHHEDSRQFDAEDVRILESLANFTTAALELQRARERAESERRQREQLVRELRRSNEELAHFSSVASHDLQAPLRAVCVFTELLQRRLKDRLDEKSSEFMAQITNGARQMEQLIRALLRYAQVGAEAVRLGTVDLKKAVQATLETLHSTVEEAGAEVTCGELPPVTADPMQVFQLLQNLVGNAIKYRRAGVAPRVHIDATANREEWRVSVSDNGEGIAESEQERIFAPLKRLHGSDISGSGIGLAICKKIVERHGGRIWAESQQGIGSTFYFTLPVGREVELPISLEIPRAEKTAVEGID